MVKRPAARARRAPVVRTVAVDEIGPESTFDEVAAWTAARGWDLHINQPIDGRPWSAVLLRPVDLDKEGNRQVAGRGDTALAALLDALEVVSERGAR